MTSLTTKEQVGSELKVLSWLKHIKNNAIRSGATFTVKLNKNEIILASFWLQTIFSCMLRNSTICCLSVSWSVIQKMFYCLQSVCFAAEPLPNWLVSLFHQCPGSKTAHSHATRSVFRKDSITFMKWFDAVRSRSVIQNKGNNTSQWLTSNST